MPTPSRQTKAAKSRRLSRVGAEMAVLQRKIVPPNFDVAQFLATAGVGRTVVKLAAKQALFSQGDEANVVFYVQAGRIRLSVVSETAKEATIALLGGGASSWGKIVLQMATPSAWRVPMQWKIRFCCGLIARRC